MYLLIKADNKQAAMDRLQNEVRLLQIQSLFGLRKEKLFSHIITKKAFNFAVFQDQYMK